MVALLQKSFKNEVIIQADASIPLSLVVEVWDICKKVGVKSINIATRNKKL